MYTKDELEQMDPVRLISAAAEVGVSVRQDDEREAVIYAILDKCAELVSQTPDTTKPKRTRALIAKKGSQQEDRIFTAKGKRAESHDRKKKKPDEGEKQTVEIDEEVLMAYPEIAAAYPKHRGRRSKAELEGMVRMKQELDAKRAESAERQVVPEAEAPQPQGQAATEDQLNQLQQHIREHNKGQASASLQTDGEAANVDEDATANPSDEAHTEASQPRQEESEDQVWEGDPGDGSDFIVIQDLPIEDNGVIPMLDMLDRPVSSPVVAPVPPAEQRGGGQQEPQIEQTVTACGVLEIQPEGYGFLRSSDYNYLSSPDDVYVSQQQVKRYALKTGDVVMAQVRPPHDGEKYFFLGQVQSVNGRSPEDIRDRVAFEHLTPLFPDHKFTLCGDRATTNPSVRLVDLFAPIGKGQRALIVAQPKTGKTLLMKDVANAIAANHPEAYLMMLLIDERPEEVTDMARTVNAEVIASTFDEPAERHVKIAAIVLEKAKRMVECGHDVVIFLDSITRLARAYNTVAPASGKILTGGVDASALQKPKRFFGAARNIEGGGSLTIIATALIDTGSKMDEVIFEEFKGTGNMELQLDRMLSNKRIFPAINLVQSSTRRDELLHDATTLNRMWILRKHISEMNPVEAMTMLRERLVQTHDNDEFLLSMNG